MSLIACSRVSPPSALVRLVDGRYGLTGRVVAVGPAYQLVWYLRRRRATATVEERHWLDQYHATVRKTLAPLVDPVTARWLDHATRSLRA